MEQLIMAVRQNKSRKKAEFFYKNEYLSALEQLEAAFSDGKDRIGLLTHAGYLLQLGGTRIAVDIAPKWFPLTEEAQKELTRLVETCDAILLTHDHGDHYDPNWLEARSIPVYAPDFLDVKGARKVTMDETVTIGSLSVRFFASRHRSVAEYGFCVDGVGKRLLFPTDVRDYEYRFPDFGDVDVVFTHLWLGRDEALTLTCNPYFHLFTEYARSFLADKIVVGHLCDPSRDNKNMWTDDHFNWLLNLLPEAICFKVGETMEL